MTAEGEQTDEGAGQSMPAGEHGNGRGTEHGNGRSPEHGPGSGTAGHAGGEAEAARRFDSERLRRAAGGGLEQAANALHRAGRTVAKRGGPTARAASAAHRLGTELDHAAAFVRSSELDELRADVESTIRVHPIRSVVVATMAGYVIGRLLRW